MLDTPLHDATESLVYWRERRARLPWYRRSARREAARMALTWERRVRGALLAASPEPFVARADAARVVARSWLARWARRAGIAALVLTALMAMTAGATFALLVHALS